MYNGVSRCVICVIFFYSQQTVTEEKYDVKRCVEEAAIIVTNNTEPRVSCTITLTSPIMRETSDGGMIGLKPIQGYNLHLLTIISVSNAVTTKKLVKQKRIFFSLLTFCRMVMARVQNCCHLLS